MTVMARRSRSREVSDLWSYSSFTERMGLAVAVLDALVLLADSLGEAAGNGKPKVHACIGFPAVLVLVGVVLSQSIKALVDDFLIIVAMSEAVILHSSLPIVVVFFAF